MKTKNLFIAGVLAIAGTAFGQVVETPTTTGIGDHNGAISLGSDPGNESTYVGVDAGRNSSPTAGLGRNTFVGHASAVQNRFGVDNTFTGYLSGQNNNSNQNSYFGSEAGRYINGSANTFLGFQSGRGGQTSVTTASGNTFIGYQSGRSVTGGNSNTATGLSAGYSLTNGSYNVFNGNEAGYSTTGGSENVFIGWLAGYANVNGSYNTCIGTFSGGQNSSSDNVFIGYSNGASNTGSNNLMVGSYTGQYNNGSGNVFLGNHAGENDSNGSNRLYIDNSSDDTPLIYGDFAQDRLVFNGRVGITNETLASQANLFPTMAGGINVSAYQLFVKGGILTEEVRVTSKSTSNWADYVFAADYKLASLPEVEKYIAANGHLPNVPSAKQVKEDGIELGDMARIQQEKIEELTLYAIAQDKKLTEQNQKLEQQQKEIDELKAAVKALMVKK